MYELGWATIIDEKSRSFVFSAMPDAPVIADSRSRGPRRPRLERWLRRRTATALHRFAEHREGGVTSPAGNQNAKEGPCAI